MLYQFTFKNFKSYKDETVFDMRAENIKEFEESLLIDKNKKLFYTAKKAGVKDFAKFNNYGYKGGYIMVKQLKI